MNEVEYYKICLEDNKMITIAERKAVLPSDCHLISNGELIDYDVLTAKSEEQSERTFESLNFKIINDYGKDGFFYDPKNKAVIYGWVEALYIVKKGDTFFEMVTKKSISKEVIDQFGEKIESTEIVPNGKMHMNQIISHRDVYEEVSNHILDELEKKISTDKGEFAYQKKKNFEESN